MGVFDHFPYTNFHELNLEWILAALKEIQQTMSDFVALNAIKYADPIQWNITRQYEKNTIVIDPLTGTAYISVRPVPDGALITNTDYWTVVFDLGQFVTKMAQNLANVVELETTLTATVPSNYKDWIIWGDILYRNINPAGIIVGDQYAVGSNIEQFSIEDIFGHIEDLTTSDKTNIVAAINSVLADLTITIGDLADLQTPDTSSIVNAINSINTTLYYLNVRDYGAVGDGVTDDTQAFMDTLADAVSIPKSVIIIPDGNYLITQTLEIIGDYGIEIRGCGKNSRLIGQGLNEDCFKIGGDTVIDTFRGSITDLAISGFDVAIHFSLRTAQWKVNNVYISGCNIGVQCLGDYRGVNIYDCINHTIENVEIEGNSRYGLYFGMCGDMYVENVQVENTGTTSYGIIIDSGATALYIRDVNCTGGLGGIHLHDGGLMNGALNTLPHQPRQNYFYNVQGDTALTFGFQLEDTYMNEFVDCWASGSQVGFVVANSAKQTMFNGCRAYGNKEDGFRIADGNANAHVQLIGCSSLGNGIEPSAPSRAGISIGSNTDSFVIMGCNCFNDDTLGLQTNCQQYGIHLWANLQYGIVVGNNVHGQQGNAFVNLGYEAGIDLDTVFILNNTGSNQYSNFIAKDITAVNGISAGHYNSLGPINAGSVTTTGDVSADNLSAANNVNASGNVNATGNVSGVNGTFTGDVSADDITASGDVSATGNVSGVNGTFTGDVSADDITASGDGSVTGRLTVGAFTLDQYATEETITPTHTITIKLAANQNIKIPIVLS